MSYSLYVLVDRLQCREHSIRGTDKIRFFSSAMNTTQNKEMASNMFWLDEITRCCQAIDREATQSLNKIQANLQNGLLVNHEFKVNFLKMINYR